MLKRKDDKALIDGCVRNDRRSQEALYRQYFSVMMGMCMRYAKNQDVAMEIVNMGFLKIFKKIHTYSYKGSFEGWMKRLVFHSLSDYYKKESRQIQFLDLPLVEKNADNSTALERLYFEDILQLVDQLKGASKEVFWMFAVEGFTHREIGEKLNISTGTSKWHVSEARKKLQLLLKQQNIINHNVG